MQASSSCYPAANIPDSRLLHSHLSSTVQTEFLCFPVNGGFNIYLTMSLWKCLWSSPYRYLLLAPVGLLIQNLWFLLRFSEIPGQDVGAGEDPELTSSHGHTKPTAMYGTISSGKKKQLKTGGATPSHQATRGKPPGSR